MKIHVARSSFSFLTRLVSPLSLAIVLTFSLLIVLSGCGAANLSHVPPGSDLPPTVSITPNAVTITAGASSTLAVSASDATQVVLSGSDGTTYTMPGTGGTQAVSPTATTTYAATATGAGGKATATATVTVSPAAAPPSPAVTLAANPDSITAGASSTLTVTATNATQVTLSGTDGTTYTLAATGGTQAVSPAATTSYTATATGAAGTTPAMAKATITVVAAPPSPPPSPTVTMAATPDTISMGSASTLTVAAANATQVTVTGTDGSSYTLQPSGGTQAVSPATTTTYTATATGPAGTTPATATATVTVVPVAPPPPPPANPSVSIAAAPASITSGGSSTLTVMAANAIQVTVTGTDGSSYTLQPGGGAQTVSPTATTTYTATATGAAGTPPASASANVTVTAPAPKAPTVAITANPASIAAGASSTLTVIASNATQVTIAGSDGSSYTLQPGGGTQVVSPAATATYTATATGAAGTTPASASATVTVTAPAPKAPTVAITANPTSVTAGGSSTLTVTASNATQVSIAGSDGSSYTLQPGGGSQAVSPTATTTYTATATGATGTTPATATTTVTVTAPAPKTPTVSISANPTSITAGASSTLTVTASNATQVTIAGSDGSSYTLQPGGGAQTVSPAATATYTATATGATGTTPATAVVTVSVTAPPAAGTANILTFHVDAHRSGLNAAEQTLTPTNVHPATFGKLFSYLVDGYVYGTPLLASNITIKGSAHNVLYAATENDSVYAFDADSYGTGAPLWHVSLLQSGETPQTTGPIKPYQGVTSTPVIDLSTSTIYVVSAQNTPGVGASFRLHALDITSGDEKFGGPVTIHASVPATNSDAVNGVETLHNSCIQRAALLLANNSIYIGFGSCHSGWLLSYNATTLQQTGVFNASPNLNGEGAYASAGGVWMGGGGPVADTAGNVYAVTGNGPWDGQTAFADSVLKFDAKLQLLDYFTPQDYQFMDCDDADLAAGGLLMIPGTSQLVAGGKMGKMYLVNGGSLGHEQAGDAGATQTLFFESDRINPYSSTCTDSSGAHTATINAYEIFGTPAYFNGAVYLGVTPTSSTAPAGVRRFTYNGKLTPDSSTSDSVQQNTRGTTPFLSANGNAAGIMWFIDTGQPIGSPAGASGATLRAFDATDLTNELYNSGSNSGDAPGYGIKFSSPIVANGKVYISTGHDLPSASNPKGELDVYGLK